MQTHEDFDMGRLEERAADTMRRGASGITAGRPGESTLDEWAHGGVHVKQLPADEQNVLRVSIGGIPGMADSNYCVFRGDRVACAAILEAALAALRRPH